ncbi:MAG: SusC/RagA family TonB-linked outer membrane protein [Gemmatimonadaceae bacterium]
MLKLFTRITSVTAALAMVATAAAAQESGTITGHVRTESGGPLTAASVTVGSLGLGGYTNDQGVYTVTVPASRMNGAAVTLTARRVGYSPKSVTIKLSGGMIQQDFSLTANATNLSGVVVTALGVSKEKSQLGTAIQTVSSDALNATHDDNVVNQLAGKVSGVQITSAGTQGGSTKITIRGANSITGNNDPLFIVDGTPVSNYDRGGSPNGGMDFGSAINDLNSDDIASITVLKGPNAAAIYGSRGANGVVLITTKRGSASANGIQTSITSNYTWDTPSILPKFQNLYGQGAGGEFQFVDGAGGGVQDFNDQSFGPRLDGRTMGCTFIPNTTTYDQTAPCTQFTSPVVNGVLQPIPWVAHPDNVSSFFQTGSTFSNNVAFSGGTERATGRLSAGVDNTTGVIPNNTFRKFSSSLAGNFNVSSRLSTSANVQYISNKGYNRAGVGYNQGILEGLYVWFGRQVDMNALKDYQPRADQTFACNGQFNWNCNYHNNPYWIQYQNPEADDRDRIIGSASAKWKITDWLNATAQTGTDYFRANIDQNYGAGNINYDDLAYNGAFTHFQNRNNENNSSLLLTADKRPTSWLQLNATFGANRRYATYNSGSVATDAILASGIYNVSNSAKSPTVNEDVERRQTNSGYGSGSFTINDIWTVEVTGRNDWSSTLPKGNNSYFYPSINSSLVLTDLAPFLKNRVLSYAKLRGSIANVGNDAAPYQLATTYVGNANKFGSLPQYTLTDTRANPTLKPENTNSGEVGLELGFLNNRATLDATYYAKATTNEIVNLSLAGETGFTGASLNAGKLTNKGFEALFTVIPIQTASGFQWTSTFNYSANRSKLVTLYPGVNNYVIGSTWTINEEARVGQPYGAIFATPYKRDAATGELLLSGGLPQNDAGNRRVLGNVNPKWLGGWNNEVRWGRFSASALLDIHRGGNIYSVTNMFGQYTGVLASSINGRQVDWDNPGLVIKGIDQATGKENTVNVTSENYYQSLFENGEAFLYDDSFVKLREVRVGYDLPTSFTRSLRVSSANIAFVGRNLWTHSKVPNIDPEFAYTTGNYQGAEFAALPTTRSLGFNLRITP